MAQKRMRTDPAETDQTRDAARQDVFEYIEIIHNPKRKHQNNACCRPLTSRSDSKDWGCTETRGTYLHAITHDILEERVIHVLPRPVPPVPLPVAMAGQLLPCSYRVKDV